MVEDEGNVDASFYLNGSKTAGLYNPCSDLYVRSVRSVRCC